MENIEVSIITMKPNFFLYLPFYYAQEENFFGFLPKGYKTTLKQISKDDEDTCEKLLEASRKGQICFGIGDPTKVIKYSENYYNNLIVLATLVTNTAFWAIIPKKHGKTQKIKNLEDLKTFEKIISYPENTTSYGLACRILQEKGVSLNLKKINSLNDIQDIGDQNLIVIDPSLEEEIIEEFRKKFLSQEKIESFALSPNILNITNYEIDKNINLIQFMLGKSKEFDNLIVTTLITYDQVVTKHEALVKGILRGLQRALIHIYLIDQDIYDPHLKGIKRKIRDKILKIVKDQFQNIKNEDVIKTAFIRAMKDRIFPRVIEITEADWETSVIVSLMAQQEKISSKSDLQNYSEKASNSYKNLISNYQKYAKEAIMLELYDPIYQKFTNPFIKIINMNIKKLLDDIWESSNLPNQVKWFLVSLVVIVPLVIGLFQTNWLIPDPSPSPSPSPIEEETKKYTVDVEVDGRPTGNIRFYYEINGIGGEESEFTDSNGSFKIDIPSDTKTIVFRVEDDKYSRYKQTVDIKNNPTKRSSHTIKLTTKNSDSTGSESGQSSSSSETKVKSIKITVKKEISDGGGIVPDAEVVLTGEKVSGTLKNRTNTNGEVFWTEAQINANAPELKVTDRITIEVKKTGWGFKSESYVVNTTNVVTSIILTRR